MHGSSRHSPSSLIRIALLCAMVASLPHSRVCAQTMTSDGSEREALLLYQSDKMVEARSAAERVLAVNESSAVAHYVLGVVLRESEGSLAPALRHLSRSRELLEERWGAHVPPGEAGTLHRDVLYATQALAGEIEEYEYQLEILDYSNRLHGPPLIAERAWPLLHLGKFAEARRAARDAIASGDAWQMSLGRNTLCAIEGRAGERQAYFDACKAAYDAALTAKVAPPSEGITGTTAVVSGGVTVHAYNAALAARALGRMDAAREYLESGASRLELTPANPWRGLALLQADSGDIGAALNSLHEMQRWRARQPAYLREQDRAESDACVAQVLYAASASDAALKLIERAILLPDRRGLVSTDREATAGAHALLRRAISLMEAERELEEGSRSGFFERIKRRFSAWGHSLDAMFDGRRVETALTDQDRLVSSLRVFLPGGIFPVQPWLLGDITDIIGEGTMESALNDVRRREGSLPLARGYIEALGAEAAQRRGDSRRAHELAQRAKSQLPAQERLLLARVSVVDALALDDLGRTREQLAALEAAYQMDPGVFRRMQVALPTRIRAVGGADMAEKAADQLALSPRFDPTSSTRAFELVVEGTAHELRACFRAPSQALLGCVQRATRRPDVEPRQNPGAIRPPNDEIHDIAYDLHAAVHNDLLSQRVMITTTDLRSLDGSTAPREVENRHELEAALEALAEDQVAAPP